MSRSAVLLCCLLLGQPLLADSSGRQVVRGEIEQRARMTVPEKALAPPRAFSVPPGVTLTDHVTADDAVAIALWNNAALEADLAAIGIAEADVLDAGLLKNPTFQTLLPVGIKPFEFLLSWPIEDLWQRKKRVLAARQNLDAVATGLVQNGLNLVRDVRLAHADLWLAQQRSTILHESASLRAGIATMTERRRDAGDASGLDVSLTAADARSATELAKRAIGEIEIARTRLRMLLGLRDDARPLSTIANARRPDVAAPEELVKAAYASRPDLRAAELAIEASVYRAKWQRSRVINVVMPLLSIKEVGSPQSTRYGPGLQMEIPIFNRNQGQVARADAEVIQAAWRYRVLRDAVEVEVREAAARLEQSLSSLDQLRTELKPIVDQTISQTETAYKNGDVSYLNVLETTRQRFDAVLRELDAEAAQARAYAELERAIGRRL